MTVSRNANRADFWRATRADDHWPLTGGYFRSVTVKFWPI